jgi:hypothetical protein
MSGEGAVVFEWMINGDWSECDCASETKTRQVYCVEEGTSTVYDDSFCSEAGTKPDTTQSCSCRVYEWKTSDWSVCDNCSNGSGTQTRTVECVDQADHTWYFFDSSCSEAGPKPSESQPCTCTTVMVNTTVVTFAISTDYMLSDQVIYEIMTRASHAFQSLDASFTKDRFMGIKQELDLTDPYNSVVKLSAHMVGISVEDANSAWDALRDELAPMSLYVDIYTPTTGEIEDVCMQGCTASAGCGMCLYGDDCDVYGGEGCKSSAAAMPVSVAAVVAMIAAVLFV